MAARRRREGGLAARFVMLRWGEYRRSEERAETKCDAASR